MALQKHIAQVSLTKGVSTKTDPKQIQANPSVLENCTFVSPGKLKKRPAFAQLGGLLNVPASSDTALATFKDELLAVRDRTLYSRTGANAYTSRGSFQSAYVTQRAVVRSPNQQSGQDCASSSGFTAVVYEDSSGGSYVRLIEPTTGAIIRTDIIVSTAIKPKVFTLGGSVVLLYVNTADSRLYAAELGGSISPVALTATSGSAQLNSTAPNYDAAVITTATETRLYIVYNDSTPTTGGLRALWVTAAAPTTPVGVTSLVAEPGTVVNVFADLRQQAPVFAYWNGTAVKFRAYDAALATAIGTGTLETVASVVSIAGISTSAFSIALTVYYTVSAAATYNYHTRYASVTGGYVVSSGSALVRSVGLAAKPFAYDTTSGTPATVYLPLVYQSPLQPTYFVAIHKVASVYVMAKLLYGQAGPIPTTRADGKGSSVLPESPAVSGSSAQFLIALLAKDLLTTQSGAVYTQTGVNLATLAMVDSQNSHLRSELGRNLHLSGGCLQMYDGAAVVEHGFHLFPEPVTASAVGSGGSLTAGIYQVAACYEWVDNQGQTHRSAPSVPVSVTVVANGSIGITIPTLRLTAKSVVVIVYVTTANGTTFYRSTSVSAPTANTTAADTVSYTHTASDATLVGNALLYTNGGILENIAAPPCSAITVHGNRIVLLDSTNPLTLWYSKQVAPGDPVEFNDALTLNIDPRGGDVTALASLDDKLIVFKRTSVFMVTGQGPAADGSQNTFSDAVLVTSDCGCTNPRSVVLVPDGLMFQTAKGIYLLGRDLTVSYIGADVEAYNAQAVTSAVLIPTTHQVRFTTAAGPMLVYDYFMRQWSTFTSSLIALAATDGCVFQNAHTIFHPTYGPGQESASAGAMDFGASYVLTRLVTSWIQLAGMQGFQRAYKLFLLGDYITAHTMRVRVAYDFATSFSQTNDIAASSSVTPLQYRIHLAKQKCESLQVSVEETGVPNGDGFTLSSLALEMGIKSGPVRLPASKSYG